MLTEKQPQSVCCRMCADQTAEQVTKIFAPKHFYSGRLSGVDFSSWTTEHCGTKEPFGKSHIPALHSAGKGPVGSYLPSMTLHPPVDSTNMKGTCIALRRENPVGSYLARQYSMGRKPKAPLGATKSNKSHDQQTAIMSYSACLLHFQTVLCEPFPFLGNLHDWLYYKTFISRTQQIHLALQYCKQFSYNLQLDCIYLFPKTISLSHIVKLI